MYIFTFLLLAIFAYNDVILKKRQLFGLFGVITIVWLIFHDGFRWGVGTDWEAYLSMFTDIDIDDYEGIEIGYVLLNRLIHFFSDNYSVFLVLHAIIVYLLVSFTVFKYSINPFLSLFLFYCLMLTYLGMNRQYIAFALCIFSFQFIYKRNFLYFIICIIIGFYFHRSAIMFIPAFFLQNKWSNKYLIGILLITILISLSGIINKLPLNIFYLLSADIGNKMNDYGSSNFSQSYTNIVFTILALIKRSFWIIIVVFFKNRINDEKGYFNLIFNMYFVATIIYITFNNTILQIIVGRGLLFYNIAEIFLIPYILALVSIRELKKMILVLLFMYGYLTFNKGIEFYKDDLGVDIYRPYNSVLIDNNYNAMDKH